MIRIALSSRSTATTTELASAIPACASDSWLEASPAIAASPSSAARVRPAVLSSITTIDPAATPRPSSVFAALRPLVPYPQMILCPRKRFLHRPTRYA